MAIQIGGWKSDVSTQSIRKWGNSLGLRIPAAVAKQMSVTEGETVTYRLVGKQLVIEKAEADLPGFTHADLVKALKKAKRTPLIDFGRPRGREVF